MESAISAIIRKLFDSDKLLTGRINGIRYQRENRSDRDVEIPPAYMITDETGAMWSFGTHFIEHNGFYEFNVIRDDVDTDQYAQRIVYRKGVVTLYGRDGRRRWTGRGFV